MTLTGLYLLYMSYMFIGSIFNQDISNWKINPNCNTGHMFNVTNMKYKYKPFKNGKRIE